MQQLVAVREYWSAGGYNATTYTYDGVGNLVKVVGPDAGQVTQYSYDDLNRLVKTTYRTGRRPEVELRRGGELVSSTDQEDRVTTYSYDFLYRLHSVNYPDGTSTTYTYDKDGNVLTMNNAVDQVKYSYDARNELHLRDGHDRRDGVPSLVLLRSQRERAVDDLPRRLEGLLLVRCARQGDEGRRC